MSEQRKMEKKLQQISFVLYETALYLDTHPRCRQALAYFDRYNRQLQELTARYESRFGPVTFHGQKEGSDRWQWVSTPWPWEFPNGNPGECPDGCGQEYVVENSGKYQGKSRRDCGCP